MARRPAAKAKPEAGRAKSSPGARSEAVRWKHFFFEFVSVAAGVLLALIVDQAAENWREHRRVADQTVSMREEIAEFGEIFRLRLDAKSCIDRKLDALQAFVEGSGPVPPLANIGRPSFFFSSRGGWNSDLGDQLSRYLGADKFKRYGELYQGMEQYAALSAAEQDTWVIFQAVEGDKDALTPDRRARLREAIAQARNQQLLMTAIAAQMLEQAREIGVRPNLSLQAQLLEVRTRQLCKPLSTGAGPAQP
jgi:hypothetical protein